MLSANTPFSPSSSQRPSNAALQAPTSRRQSRTASSCLQCRPDPRSSFLARALALCAPQQRASRSGTSASAKLHLLLWCPRLPRLPRLPSNSSRLFRPPSPSPALSPIRTAWRLPSSSSIKPSPTRKTAPHPPPTPAAATPEPIVVYLPTCLTCRSTSHTLLSPIQTTTLLQPQLHPIPSFAGPAVSIVSRSRPPFPSVDHHDSRFLG